MLDPDLFDAFGSVRFDAVSEQRVIRMILDNRSSLFGRMCETAQDLNRFRAALSAPAA